MSESPPSSILIVEDDPSLREGLALNLRHKGHRVQTAADGEAGLVAAFDSDCDLIVLDLMLPKLTGLELLDEMRRRGNDTPVLILSARDALHDKVQGLRQGADDYVTKPFELPELLARIEAMLRRRRQEQEREPEIRCGELCIDPASHEVLRAGEPVALSAREFRLLLLLARRPGQVYARDEILNQVWGWAYEGTPRTVDNLIAKLRQKLEADPARPEWIQTVRGVGYRWAP